MKVLFAAPENAWGGFLGLIRKALPEHHFEATGGFQVDHLDGYDVLIPTMTRITADLIERSRGLRLIQQCGSGLEGVDLKAAAEKKIVVANVPAQISGNADSVAELGIFMMIGLLRDVGAMAKSLRKRKMGEPQGKTLFGKTVGLIGLGGIGKALIRRLKGFDVRLIGIKRQGQMEAAQSLGLDWVGAAGDIKTLLHRSDFVVLCLPQTQESTHLINHNTLSYMKKEAYLINLSRGGIVDRDALENALENKIIAGAGLDVFWEEPPDPDDPIFKYNVLATPHIGGSTDKSMQGITRAVAENIRRIEKNLPVLNTA